MLEGQTLLLLELVFEAVLAGVIDDPVRVSKLGETTLEYAQFVHLLIINYYICKGVVGGIHLKGSRCLSPIFKLAWFKLA